MPRENDNPQIWKYFKKGDVVKDSEDSTWGNTRFEITYFHGNIYCPLVSVNLCGKFHTNGNPRRCNLDVREIKLISAKHRPFQRLKKIPLLKLMSRRNEEAKREFLIRKNTKTL